MACINIPHGTVQHSLIRKARQVPALTARRCVSMAGAATDMPSTSAAGLAQKIVPATIDDLKSIAHNNVVMAKESEDLEIPQDVSTKGVKILLETPAKGHFYVIKDQGNVIAQLMITFEWSDWRAKDIWWIQSVYVNPTYRRQGLFTALYKHAQEESRKAGACGLRLYADTDNERAHKTYEAMGMISHYKVYEALNTKY